MRKEDLIELKKKILELSNEEKKERDIYLRDIAIGRTLGPITNYASIDKPWLKYYSEENIDILRENCTAYEFMKRHNSDNLSSNALNYMGHILSYNELIDYIDKVTKSLIKLNVKSGDIVTLIMANIPENVYLFYALNRLGVLVNIIDPRLKNDEILDILNNSNSNLVFAIDTFIQNKDIKNIKDNSNVKNFILVNPLETVKNDNMFFKIITKVKSIKETISNNLYMTWDEFIVLGNNIEIKNLNLYDEKQEAIMVRTGGTTGKPKSVVLTNKNLNEMANQHFLGEYNFNKKDTFLNFLPPFIAYGICCATHMPLVLGLENILIPKFDAKDFPKLMMKYKPNVVFGGPILYEKMMSNKMTKDTDLSNLNVPVSGGDTMNLELEKKINEYFRKNGCYYHIGQGYGMTEVSSSACYSKENAYTSGSVGIPLINNSISIFDPKTTEEKEIGEVGEICIKTETVMSRYLNNKDEYNLVVKQHEDGEIWVHTGDLGYMNKDGNLFVIGRMKRMIVSNGNKIFPSTMENIICQNPNVEGCVVVGAPHAKYRNVPIAHIILKNNSVNKEILIKELNNAVKKELPDYYLPFVYVFRDSYPLTSINKIDYKDLEKEMYDFNNKIVVVSQNKRKVLKRGK